MSTDELVAEVADALLMGAIGQTIDDRREARYERICRELARRDYRFRPHGKACSCADCWMLWDTWTGWWRRSEQSSPDDWEPMP